MILVRDVFHLRFGKAREAIALWREGLAAHRHPGGTTPPRLLTDVAGAPYYTLVLEATYDSLADYEHEAQRASDDPAWREWYQRFVPLVESGRREVFTIVGGAVPSLAMGDAREQEALGHS